MRMNGPVLTVLAATLAVAGCNSHGQEAAVPQPPRPVLVAAVHYVPSAPTRSLSGTIRARVESDLGFRVGGKVVRRLVDTGAQVGAGQPLAELDPIDLALQLRQARADLAAATTARDTTASELKRIETLRRAGWSTGSDWDRQRAAADEAVGRYERAAQAVTLAERAAGYGTLLADAAGVITATMCEPGQVVTAGQTVMRLARLDEREAAVAVPEAFVDEVRHGQARVTLWALPGQSFPATLRELTPAADAATRTYAARFSLPGVADAAMLGMTATVTVTRDATPVAHLPMSALLDEGQGAAVFVADPATGALTRRPVTVAGYARGEALVEGGVTEGEQVVTLGVQKLDAAQRVRVVSKLQS